MEAFVLRYFCLGGVDFGDGSLSVGLSPAHGVKHPVSFVLPFTSTLLQI